MPPRFCMGLAALALLVFATAASGRETLYATSLRAQIGGAAFIAGNLYVVDPSTAVTRLIGAIKVGETPVGVLALATHPQTGVVYGITAGLTTGLPRSLIEIDLESATARVVARLPTRGSDLGFAPDGTLYMWAPDLRRLVSLDIESGNATPVGPVIEGAGAGAIAVFPDGVHALLAVNGASGRLYKVDVRTGEITPGAELAGAPFDASLDNLTFSPSGELYGVNSDGGAPSKTALVTVDARIGAVTRIGALPDDVRGLIFATERSRGFVSRETVRFWALVALGVVALGLIIVAMRRPAG
jgi:hypothetical protein